MALTKYMARAPGIKHMGPYDTEQEAWKSVMGLDEVPVEGASVWPVEVGSDEDSRPKENRTQPPPGMFLSMGGQVIVNAQGMPKEQVEQAWKILDKVREEAARAERERIFGLLKEIGGDALKEPFEQMRQLVRTREGERDAAHDLWTWLPSYNAATLAHGDYADENAFNVESVMWEASTVFSYLKGFRELDEEALEMFGCSCGECPAPTAEEVLSSLAVKRGCKKDGDG